MDITHFMCEKAESLLPEVTRIRRDLHRHPEVSFEEHRTAGIVAERLRSLGLEVKTGIARTGVVGLLEGTHPGRTLAIRADMDALAIDEEGDLPFKSENAGAARERPSQARDAAARSGGCTAAGLSSKPAGPGSRHGTLGFSRSPHSPSRLLLHAAHPSGTSGRGVQQRLWTPFPEPRKRCFPDPQAVGVFHLIYFCLKFYHFQNSKAFHNFLVVLAYSV